MNKRYCFNHKIGSIGDFATQWWDERDWKKYRESIEELKRTGEYGKEVTTCYELVHCPLYDDSNIMDNMGKDKSTFQFIIFDVSN